MKSFLIALTLSSPLWADKLNLNCVHFQIEKGKELNFKVDYDGRLSNARELQRFRVESRLIEPGAEQMHSVVVPFTETRISDFQFAETKFAVEGKNFSMDENNVFSIKRQRELEDGRTESYALLLAEDLEGMYTLYYVMKAGSEEIVGDSPCRRVN